MISGIPAGSQLVAASRSEQPHLHRLRAPGDALELLARDLALDATGAEQIFAQRDVNLTPELAAAMTRTDRGMARRAVPRGPDRQGERRGRAVDHR